MKLFHTFLCILTLFISVIPPLHAQSQTKPFGLWVECEGRLSTLNKKSSILEMIDDAASMGITDLFIQVHRGNRAWFDSSYADTTPYQTIMEKEKIDPVRFTIDNAKKHGMRVHLWMNCFRMLRNLDAPIVENLGTKIFTRDGKKRLITDYPKEDLPDGGFWLDAGDLQVQDYLVKLMTEAIDKYPDAEGIHLDFVRYPYRVPFYPGSQWASGHGFGYGIDSVNRFEQQTGLNPFTMEMTRENAQKWDSWRRDQVTAFVQKMSNVCKSRNKKISTAGICWADRAYLSAFQDWRRWLDDGTVSFVASMNYTTDRRFARYISREAIASKSNSQAYIGIGSYMLTDQPDNMAGQIDDALQLGADGIILFSYDAIKPYPALMKVVAGKAR